MRKIPLQPILAIAIGLLVVVGTLWIINPTDGLFSLMAPATAKEEYRYAAKPVGSDGPASQCVVCHSVEKDGPMRVAPGLWGIVGSSKARVKSYGYSRALREAGGAWTEQELDQYLADPGKFLPGTSKTIGLTDSKERAKIIAFLAILKD